MFSRSAAATLLCAVLALGSAHLSAAEGDLARGWGDSIHWRGLDDAFEEAKLMHKPIMMVIHKSWCGACKALKPQFARSERVAELSKFFVMTNLMDDEEPKGAQYRPDGGYIPRILFLDSSGRVEPSLTTPNGNPAYKYFYSNEAQLIGGMNNAMKHFAKPPQEELDDDAELEELPDTMVEDEQVEEFELHERLSDEL